ncbi:BCCT family transporter [Fulvimarina endophytica]|uniref:BCCT family transporter n=1 Tax=Fulvimarina endophytica TaxID=2293836 RepID=A0A371XAW0_9HYPH|nr:BCCT family transporter [Fulvimarina endophytica]RFC66376.1 BCCT family transporter [Fulvimarina endophytica]
MTYLISFGVLMALVLVVFCTIRWWNMRLVGPNPVPLLVFVAILFTSGLDVGLIMFPLAFDFPLYADTAENPAYAFSNPLALEFGFWGFLIWSFYFLTTFYFCAIEPRVRFFDKPVVRFVNNVVIITTCAFTGSLFLVYLPFYLPTIGDGETVVTAFYVIVFLTVLAAAYSSTDIRYVRILSIGSSTAFACLIALLWINAGITPSQFGASISNIGSYFANIHKFVIPLTDYHEFYLFWWFAWSIMIGQFTSRFVGGIKTQHMLLALLVIPSIPLAIWFSVLYHYYTAGISTDGILNIAMVIVGTTFVINSLDSLIRLYTDNLDLTAERFGKWRYVAGNTLVLFVLVLLFKSQWLQIEWIGAIVIALYVSAIVYIATRAGNVLKDARGTYGTPQFDRSTSGEG